jgi:hypothetical protein
LNGTNPLPGIALGMVALGHGNSNVGLSDVRLEERLIRSIEVFFCSVINEFFQIHRRRQEIRGSANQVHTGVGGSKVRNDLSVLLAFD